MSLASAMTKDGLVEEVLCPFSHPCPKKKHHPGENCMCALRLPVEVPHGYSRAADLGSVHVSRLQNLRWRISATCMQEQLQTLPPSLRGLAKDHSGDATSKSLRPLSPHRIRQGALRRHISEDVAQLYRIRQSALRLRKAVSEDVLQSEGAYGVDAKATKSVKFSHNFDAEVPVIGKWSTRLIPVPKRSRPSPDEAARYHLEKINNNNQAITCCSGECMAFLWELFIDSKRCDNIMLE